MNSRKILDEYKKVLKQNESALQTESCWVTEHRYGINLPSGIGRKAICFDLHSLSNEFMIVTSRCLAAVVKPETGPGSLGSTNYLINVTLFNNLLTPKCRGVSKYRKKFILSD